MTERQKLLKRVQMFDFILDELNLFLDTHPTNKQALNNFTKYQFLKNEAATQYMNKYGPLRAEDFAGGNSFDYVNSPWPWERED